MSGSADTRQELMLPAQWDTLVDAVRAGECTPFLGAGVSVPYLPRGADLARDLADEYDYPLDDRTNLARVGQYIAVTRAPDFARRRVCERITDAQKLAAAELRDAVPENHRLLAGLRLPIYVTTNYDDYMQRALGGVGGLTPTMQICRWADRLDLPKYDKDSPTVERPLVFHLHGHVSKPQSALVTEDDYIDFTVRLSRKDMKIDPALPLYVRRALGNTTLLYVGYSLEDWNFRVLMRSLMRQQQVQPHERGNNISVQLSSDGITDPQRRARAEEFLTNYLSTSQNVDVYWGTASEFLSELRRRLDEPAASRAS